MPATLKPIPPVSCTCGKPVAVEVFNKFGVSVGRWCRPCGQQYVNQLNSAENATAFPDGKRPKKRA
ncbi:MAG: hypothetical protein Q7J25_12305 [Vicinamibacterales bacterium]|nr:hypothetical protein [Vicinamibacterales bacterium]